MKVLIQMGTRIEGIPHDGRAATRGWRGSPAWPGTAAPTCSGCARATTARTARPGAAPAVAGSSASPRALTSGTTPARSRCRRRSGSRIIPAWPSPVTGSLCCPRRARLCGSGSSSRAAGRWPARGGPTVSRPTGTAGLPTATWRAFPGSPPTGSWWSPTGPRRGSSPSTAEPRTSRSMSSTSPELPLRALFQRRIAGDDALLELARLRFAQAGLAAELYADTPEQLDRGLSFAPAGMPTVHLGRAINLLDPGDREVVRGFADRFAGRVWGLVVHDKREMATRTDELVA